MRTTLDEPEEAFRREIVAFLAEHERVDGFFHHEGEYEARIRSLYRALGERGWLSLSWPTTVGGMGLPPVYEFVLWDEMAYARAARPPLGSGIVAKTIIAHGTADQHERFLPGLKDGTVFFSLGYSEPEAGSDLGRVRTRAVRDGDRYILNGEKRWTSGGHRADYLWVLCRTGDLESRSRGLTLLIVDRRSPGITVSPIPVLDGGRLNEVRFDDVEVPMTNRVGGEGEAWTIMVQALATERHVQFPPKRVQRDFEDLVDWVRSVGLASDPMVRQRLADLSVEVAEAKALALLMLEAVQQQREAAVEAASNKLVGAELCQRIARAAFDLGAPEAVVRGPMVEFLWRQSICETIGGGTSEIMRGVVSRQLLGLASSR
ncbi:MAG: acyl-CoA dehydrogenase family protein [Acidimicrobiales bacterium]